MTNREDTTSTTLSNLLTNMQLPLSQPPTDTSNGNAVIYVTEAQIQEVFAELDKSEAIVGKLLNEAELKNAEHLMWKEKETRIVGLIDEANQELIHNRGLLTSLEKIYQKEKAQVISGLEQGISNTLNTWYTGAKYDIQLEKVPKTKTEQYLLSDRNMASDLATITGGSAAQVTGSLIQSSVLESEDSTFIMFDEAFCNTDARTAKEIGEMLSRGMPDKQIILIENKEDLTNEVEGLKYYLYYTKETGTGVIKVVDDYNELDNDSNLLQVKDATIPDFIDLKTEDELLKDGETVPYTII